MSVCQKGESAFEVAVKLGKLDVAVYLYRVKFGEGVSNGQSEKDQNLVSLAAVRPPGLLHYIAKCTEYGDMATWLLSIGYRMDDEDEVNAFSLPLFLYSRILPRNCMIVFQYLRYD